MRARNIPEFPDDVLEIDEVLDSIAWDLCGRREALRPPSLRPPKNTAQVVPQA